jgi:hypothetical protein
MIFKEIDNIRDVGVICHYLAIAIVFQYRLDYSHHARHLTISVSIDLFRGPKHIQYFIVVIHSSLMPIKIDTPNLMNDLSLGNAPITLDLLFSSLLIFSSPLVVLILLQCSLRNAPAASSNSSRS